MVNKTELLREFLAEHPEYIPDCRKADSSTLLMSPELIVKFSRWAVDNGKLPPEEASVLKSTLDKFQEPSS